MVNLRDVLLVVSEINEGKPHGLVTVPMTGIPSNSTVGFWVSLYLEKNGPISRAPNMSGGTIDQYELWDWTVNDITAATHIGEIPRPGIFFVTRWPKLDQSQTLVWRVNLKDSILESEAGKKFMKGPGPFFEPVTVTVPTFDVFISYASENEPLAMEFYESLDAKGMKCFLSKKSIGASDLWREEIRRALQNSSVVLELTPVAQAAIPIPIRPRCSTSRSGQLKTT
jgi:TIR domain